MRISTNALQKAALSAIFSAALYAACIPCIKILGKHVAPAFTGAFLYLGAGLGLMLTMLFKGVSVELALTKKEIPWAVSMVLLDTLAVCALAAGVLLTSGANVSLLGNFELVATSCAAYLFFSEYISKRLFAAIILITIASIVLSFEGAGSFVFNKGSALVLISCVCWGLENNCTKRLSLKDTRQIAMIKGCFAGLFGLFAAFFAHNPLPQLKWAILVMLTGFMSYGISVSLYIYAQRFLGAARAGAYYSAAPFFGVVFSLLILNERPDVKFYIALLIMLTASILVILDTKNS